jgi:hypothetical protein
VLQYLWLGGFVVVLLALIIAIAVIGAYAITAGFQLVDDADTQR